MISQDLCADRGRRLRAVGLGQLGEVVVDELCGFGRRLRVGDRRRRHGHGGESAHAPREQSRSQAMLVKAGRHGGVTRRLGTSEPAVADPRLDDRGGTDRLELLHHGMDLAPLHHRPDGAP